MTNEGPPLALLTRRLAQCPPDVWDEALSLANIEAVLCDALLDLGEPRPAPFALSPDAQSNERSWLLLGAWLLRDPWFQAQASARTAAGARLWLQNEAPTLALLLEVRSALADVDRREEIARRILAALDLRPQGESLTQAQDRLRTLDSVERQKVILEARRAQERARQIREEMARRAAEEAAARYGRE